MSDPENATKRGWAQKPPRRRIHAQLVEAAREMRKNPTPAEQALWKCLRNRQLGYKFRRQQVIGRFIVDFYCAEARLVVEVDGSSHDEQIEYDQARTEYLERLGLRMVRYANLDVMHNIEGVVTHLCAILRGETSP